MKILFTVVLLLNVAYGYYAVRDYKSKRKIRVESLAILQNRSMKRIYSAEYINRKITEVKECESISEARDLFNELVLKKNDAKRTLLFKKGNGKQQKKYYLEWQVEKE